MRIYAKRYSAHFRTEDDARRSWALFHLSVCDVPPDEIPAFPLEQQQPVYPNKVYTDPSHSPLWCPSDVHRHPYETIKRTHLYDPRWDLVFDAKKLADNMEARDELRRM